MIELFGELLKNNVSGYIIIAVLFVWFFFHINKQQNNRENKLLDHNEKYQEILEKQSDIIERQGLLLDRLRESMDKQAEQLGRVALVVDSIGSETERMRQQLNEMQEKQQRLNRQIS